MRPILFSVGLTPIWAYGTFVALGVLSLYLLALLPARRDGRSWDQLMLTGVGVGAGGVIGARLSHFFVEPERFSSLFDFYSLFVPGTPGNVVGLMVGGFLGGQIIRHRFNLPSVGNYFAPALAAASVVWRTGCVLAGACHGKTTQLPSLDAASAAIFYPPPFFDGLFNLFLFLLLWRWRGRVNRDNALLYVYLGSYAFFRFWLEFISDYPPVAAGLTGVQIMCLAILASIGVWWWRSRRANTRQSLTEGSPG